MVRRTAGEVPCASFSKAQLDEIASFGVIEPIRAADVRGAMRVFGVPEIAKERQRVIMHTVDVNDATTKEMLRKCTFPSKHEICQLVHSGDGAIALDFRSYYYQFKYDRRISPLLCTMSPDGRFFQQRRLSMGQRASCEVADAATAMMMDSPGRTSTARSVIDNAIFVGSRDEVVRDARNFINRAHSVGATFNEATDDVAALFTNRMEWCGVDLDFVAKSACLTEKTVRKTVDSWAGRKRWTWRTFAAHVGLLFWAVGIIDVPMHRMFPVLSFVSHVGRMMQEAGDALWDEPAYVWKSVWPALERWTDLVLRNERKRVPPPGAPEWIVCTDASGWGWGYVAQNLTSGETRTFGARWSYAMRSIHGAKLGQSVYAEPLAITNSLCHLFSSTNVPGRVLVGTDNTAARASFARGWNARSYAINSSLARFRDRFPGVVAEFVHVPGATNPADPFSRGRSAAADESGRVLRRNLGYDEAPATGAPFIAQ